MTVRLLRDVLDEMGVPYNKTSKKAELIQKVKEAGKETRNYKSGQRDKKRFYERHNDR